MVYPSRRPPDPRPAVRLSYQTPPAEALKPIGQSLGLLCAGSAVVGACYLLLILMLREASPVANLLWDIGVGFVLIVPVAAGAGLTLGWPSLFGRRFRWQNAAVFTLASLALAIYTVFWIAARAANSSLKFGM